MMCNLGVVSVCIRGIKDSKIRSGREMNSDGEAEQLGKEAGRILRPHGEVSRVTKTENCDLGEISTQGNPLETEPHHLVGVERMNQPGRGDGVETGRKTDEGRTSVLSHVLGPI